MGRLRRVVIDPGHGGRDPGAVGRRNGEQILEKDLNLDIALYAADLLAARPDIHVEVTHEGNAAEWQEVFLEDRVDFSNRHSADIFVSVHCNAMAPGSSAHGFEVFHFRNSMSGHKLATALFGAIARNIGEIAPRSVKGSGFYVLRHTAAPAALVECGFMTSPNDLEMLVDKPFRNRYGTAIAQGILDYFGLG